MNRQLSGMDIGQIRAVAKNMDRKADELRGLVNGLTSEVNAASWAGNDRNRFVDDWRNRHAVALIRVADDLDAAARQARDHANAQERASRVR